MRKCLPQWIEGETVRSESAKILITISLRSKQNQVVPLYTIPPYVCWHYLQRNLQNLTNI